MGLFNKHKKEADKPVLPKLPELPELPRLDNFNHPGEPEEIHQLPSFPTNSFGEKFSQNTIKNAVIGEEEEEMLERDFPDIPKRMKQAPINQLPPAISTQEVSPNYKKRSISTQPIFVRMDRFEESLEIFEDTKEKIRDMEDLLSEIKSLKQKEEEELSLWENEIQQLKKHVEKVDKDIFSKIE